MNLKKILVPVDFSENSRKALDAALTLHRLSPAEITLLYVVEPLMIAFGEALPGDLPTDQERTAAAEGEMQKLRGQFPAECPLDTLVLEGTAWDVICDTAQRRDTDLIVIASHGYTGLKRILLGSTAERVVRHAHTPVLVVKSYPEEAKSRVGR